nr:hypothetical protein [Tanacetum cinerariifolium]
MAFISSIKHSSRNEDGNIACVPTASTNVPTASASVATISQDTACAYIASQSSGIPQAMIEEGETPTDKAVAQLESRLVEYKEMEVKYIEKIRTLEMYRASNLKCIKTLDKELETLKEEKDVVDGKLTRLLKSSKDLENLIQSQRSDKIKEGVGYNAVPPPAAILYLFPKKDLSWTGLPEFADNTVTDYSRPAPTVEKDHALVADEVAPTEFALMANTSAESKKLKTLKLEKDGVDGKLEGLLKASKDLDNLIESQRSDKIKDGLECADDTITDYSRPSPTVESASGDDQNRNPFVSETIASPITPKPFIKFVKPKDNQSNSKT